eukprot:gene13313-14627_t
MNNQDNALLDFFVECFRPMYCCGYDHPDEEEKAMFKNWKGIQQHYRLYHKVSIYSKKPWDPNIPKYTVIEMEENKKEKKRKRSIKQSAKKKRFKTSTIVANHDFYTVTTDEDQDNVDKFQSFLNSISLLAKVTDDPEMLNQNIQKALQDESEVFIQMIQPFTLSKLSEYENQKSNYHKIIEELTINSGSFQDQLISLEQIKFMDRKERIKQINMTKVCLLTLELSHNILKNPEYIALLSLQKCLN